MPKGLFATDFHGSRTSYIALLHKAQEIKPDFLILGGDLLPRVDWYGQRQFIKNFLQNIFEQIAENTQIFVIMGNLDWLPATTAIEEMQESKLLKFIHKKIETSGELKIFGFGFTPVSPFSPKDWERFDTASQNIPPQPASTYINTEKGRKPIDIFKDIKILPTIEDELLPYTELLSDNRFIFVSHSPPYNTKLDMVSREEHVGSIAIRNFIEKTSPIFSLHGHLHESCFISGSISDTIGKTVCINPGSSERELRAVLLNITLSEFDFRLL